MYLSLQSLSCRRGGRLLFRGLSVELGPGAALMVRGPNGSGKSSLLRLLAGFLDAEGRILWRDAAEQDWEETGCGSRAAYLGHVNGVKPQLTVTENLRFWTALAGAGPADAGAALDLMGLAALEDMQARLLSAGQQRRLALCRLGVSGRPLWLLDEPEAALDDASRAALLRLVAGHRAAGGIAVIASHTMPDLPESRALVLASGATMGLKA